MALEFSHDHTDCFFTWLVCSLSSLLCRCNGNYYMLLVLVQDSNKSQHIRHVLNLFFPSWTSSRSKIRELPLGWIKPLSRAFYADAT